MLRLVILLTSFAANLLFTAPANSGLILRHQPDGSSFMARARGEAFFGWHETAAGFPIKKNHATGRWVYRLGPGDTGSTVRMVGIGEAKLLAFCVRFTNSPPDASLKPVSYFQHLI